MTDLVDLAINAHGGLSRWNEVRELAAQVSLTGPMYAIKGQPQGMANVSMHVDTRVPAIDVSPFPRSGHVGHFRPGRTFVSDETGKLIDERERPRETFAGHILSSRWDTSQLLYFNAYAMWNYLSTPFMFTRPGFQLKELDAHRENDTLWRRLHVTFPADIPSHCREQIFYFNQDGVLQRIDYVTDVAGGVAAHYCYDHMWFGGIFFPTLRRVVRRTEDGASPSTPTAILIRITDILVR
jgi:hypothetical protein